MADTKGSEIVPFQSGLRYQLQFFRRETFSKHLFQKIRFVDASYHVHFIFENIRAFLERRNRRVRISSNLMCVCPCPIVWHSYPRSLERAWEGWDLYSNHWVNVRTFERQKDPDKPILNKTIYDQYTITTCSYDQ